MEDGPDGTRRPAWNDGHSEVAVHPSSINHMLAANQYQRPYQIYLEKVGLASCAARCSCTLSHLADILREQIFASHQPIWAELPCAEFPWAYHHFDPQSPCKHCDSHAFDIELNLQVKTSKVFMRDCTVVAPMALLLFGGSLDILHQSGYVQIDGWLKIKAAAPVAVLVKQLRQALESVLERRISSPAEASQAADLTILQQVATLLNDEERQLGARA